MPWEVTIRRRDNGPLGDVETVRELITAALPDMEFHREPSETEKIAAARAACVEFPDVIRQQMEQQPATLQAAFEGDEFSIALYGFESQPLTKIHAEVRGNGNPVWVLAALCRPNGWLAVDDASGHPIDLAGDTAAGWEAFRAYRDRGVRQIHAT